MCHQVQHCIEPGNSGEKEIGCFYIPQYAFPPVVLFMHGKENATLSYGKHNRGLGVGVGEGRNGSGEIFSDAPKATQVISGGDATACGTSFSWGVRRIQ